jgi:hypothetical protein
MLSFGHMPRGNTTAPKFRDIFKHFSLLPFFRRLSFFCGEDVKKICVRGTHSKIFWRGVKIFSTNFLRVYNLEVGITQGGTMVGAEQKNFETLKSLDRRKWHFQNLVWPSASCPFGTDLLNYFSK